MDNEVATKENSDIQRRSADEIIKSIDNLQRGAEVTGDYLQIEPMESVKGIVTGIKEIPNMSGDGTIKAVRLYIKDPETGKGKGVITAEVVLRSTLGPIAEKVENKEIPSPYIEIECTGHTKGPKGEYKTFKVYELE